MPFLASFLVVSVSVLSAIVPAIQMPHFGSDRPPFPAPPGYVLPWSGGELHTVTQGEETPFTHNGAAAYAFDFDVSYDTVVASRSGKVTMVRQDSNTGGCNASFSDAANYVVVDHGDGTSGLYLHLAQNSAVVKVGDLVEQGQPLAMSGETGLTCSDDGSGPGPHLHFQVERTEEGRYFTQSLPVAFDDVSKGAGVPQENQTYASGNYGRGKQQKIKLTPHRVPREFNPIATPAVPGLLEGDPKPVVTPPPADLSPAAAAPTDRGAPTDAPASNAPPADAPTAPDSTRTPRPTRTPTPEPSDTPLPAPSDTPVPQPSETPAPRPSDTPIPLPPSETPAGAPTATSTPSAPTTALAPGSPPAIQTTVAGTVTAAANAAPAGAGAPPG